MNAVRTIAWKEIRSFLREKLQLGVVVLAVLFVGVLTLLRFGSGGFLVAPIAAVFGGVYVLSYTSFNGERLNKTLSTLLASPIRVSEFFLGKIVAIFIATYLLNLVAVSLSGLTMWFKWEELPSISLVLGALVAIPIWGIALAELLGLVYILFGNPVALRLVGIVVIVVLINPELASRIRVLLSSPTIPIAFGTGIAILLYFLLGRVDKDRMAMV